MTAHPIPENHGCWWLTTWPSWNRLHAIPGGVLSAQRMREAIDAGEPVEVTAACGIAVEAVMPGVISRMGMRRCCLCCWALEIADGYGTPANEMSMARRMAA